MPLIIDTPADDSPIGLSDLIDYLEETKVDTTEEAAMVEAAPMLKRLANNKDFLADIALEELKSRNNLGASGNRYGPQVIMLHPPKSRGQTFFMRANFWPSPRDHIFKSSGPEQFFYHHPHDHAFNFLTVGYFGPGYSSNYYVYDYENVAGFPGEASGMKFVERSTLEEGKVMLYRACYDIHDQLPPESMSITLNIMELSSRGNVLDQYSFDTEEGTVSDVINKMSAASLMPLLSCTENGVDYLDDVAKRHPAGRVRISALKALASTAPDRASCVSALEGGLGNDHPIVVGWSRNKMSELLGDPRAAN